MWKRYCLSAILCVLGVFCIISEPVKALELGQSGFTNWDTSNSRVYTNDPDFWALNESDGQGGVARAFSNVTGGKIDYLRLCPTGRIPADSLFTFSVIAKLSNSFTNMPLSGGSDQTLLNSSYGDHGTNTYTFYTSTEINDCVWFPVGGTANDNLSLIGGALIHATRPTWVRITDSGGISSADLNTQLNAIRYLQQDQYNRLVDIISNIDENNETLENILDKIDDLSLDMSGSVQEGVEAANETEKEQIQDASDEGEDAANDAGDTAEDDTATITEQMGDIIGVFQTQASDCVIPLNLGHGVNAGNLNMCSQVPPVIKNLIGFAATAIVALVVVRLLHTIINTYLEFIESFQR